MFLRECEREELLKEKVCGHNSDKMAVEQGTIHFWIRGTDAHATDKRLGGRREMSFVKVPIRFAVTLVSDQFNELLVVES